MQKRTFLIQLMLLAGLLLSVGILFGCDTPAANPGCGGVQQIEQRDCVVMIGDSIFALSGEEEKALRNLSGQAYRTYYVSGAQMEGGMVKDIESQFDQALRQGSIRTLIMDGGGNDFFFGGANNQKIIAEISAAYERIFEKAANAGVENIIVQGYYTTKDEDAATIVSEQQVAKLTEEAGVKYGMNTVYFDPSNDQWFASRAADGRYDYLKADGIHPTTVAAGELARLLWDNMVAAGMEQNEGCRNF